MKVRRNFGRRGNHREGIGEPKWDERTNGEKPSEHFNKDGECEGNTEEGMNNPKDVWKGW